jgi:hypothetical protein
MVATRRTGCRASVSRQEEMRGGGTTNGEKKEQPHSCSFTGLGDTGGAGTTGPREQVGPEQGQGLLGRGWVGLGTVPSFMRESKLPADIRLVCVGYSQPARAVAGMKRAAARNASGTPNGWRIRRRTIVRTRRNLQWTKGKINEKKFSKIHYSASEDNDTSFLAQCKPNVELNKKKSNTGSHSNSITSYEATQVRPSSTID